LNFPWLLPGTTVWEDGEETVLFSPITGRAARLHPSTLAALNQNPASPALGAVKKRLAELHVVPGASKPWEDLVPVRSRLVLFLPDEALLWMPVPGYRGPGGYGYRAFRLAPPAWRLWQAVNDARPLHRVAEMAGLTLIQAQAVCASLCTLEVQALQLRPEPPRARDMALERLVDLPRPPNSRPEHVHGPFGETTLTWYHLHGITDGATHFDTRETTVAHTFAEPHPALHGRRYGEALADSLRLRGWLPDPSARWVEVGCGTGELARDLLRASGHPPSRYWRVDLSPELLRTQQGRVPETQGILADAVHLPFADESLDFVLSNEVIADLQAVPVDRENPEGEAARAALTAAQNAGITLPPGRSWVNLGAWRLVAQIARVLRPGGRAWLSEFGTRDGVPEEAAQLDHPEVSIQADDLARVAQAAGLEVQVEPLPDALGFDLRTFWLARPSWHAVRALAAARGIHLPARAWTAASLAKELPFRLEGLRDTPLADDGPGPLVTRFYVWTLHKPAR
jgi:SAM-dependent methyltransferase